MQKIGLVSYQFWYNYGTCLQAYALWKKIQMLGFDSEYIDFGWHYPFVEEHITFISKVKAYVRSFLKLDKYEKENAENIIANNLRFDEFRKQYIHESHPINIDTLNSINTQYWKFIVGSDQTWNPDCVEEKFFKVFLLSFVQDSLKKCAYAPSVGKSHVSTHCEYLFKKFLSDFDYISCREISGCRILSDVLNKNIQQVLDPTMLLDYRDWNKIAKNPINAKDYILCYILGGKTCICDYAKKLANKFGKRLYIISTNSYLYKRYSKYILHGIGPAEFVGLIRDCSCLVTDSFHGTIFSINFRKNFYTFYKRQGTFQESDNSRILDTLKLFGLEDRLRNDGDYSFCNSIDYNLVSLQVEKLRSESTIFLQKILNT